MANVTQWNTEVLCSCATPQVQVLITCHQNHQNSIRSCFFLCLQFHLFSIPIIFLNLMSVNVELLKLFKMLFSSFFLKAHLCLIKHQSFQLHFPPSLQLLNNSFPQFPQSHVPFLMCLSMLFPLSKIPFSPSLYTCSSFKQQLRYHSFKHFILQITSHSLLCISIILHLYSILEKMTCSPFSLTPSAFKNEQRGLKVHDKSRKTS